MNKKIYSILLVGLIVSCGSEHNRPSNFSPDDSRIKLFNFEPMRGACTAYDKRHHIYKGNRKFLRSWNQCGKDSWGSADSTTKCLKNDFPTLSQGCAQCFGNVIGCARQSCFWDCSFGSDAACEKCSKQKCFPDLYRCGGIRERDVP